MSSLANNYNRRKIAFKKGKGSFLYSTNGKKYLDFVQGIAVNSLGHSNSYLIRAINKQSKKVWHVSNAFIIPEGEKLAKRFFLERGNPKVAWDAGVNSGPIQIALKYNISTVFYAEHGESEYGGLVLDNESEKKRDLREVIEHQIGDYPENWVSEEVNLKDLTPYIYPTNEQIGKNKINAYYFSYFFKWSMLDNYNYVKKKLPSFKTNPNGRTEGTFTNFDSLDDKIDCIYYYMQYIKFGFGRATRDSCRMIQNNQMNREEAVKLAKQYDSEFPSKDFNEVLDYLNLNQNQFEEIINKHRNHEIWKTGRNNHWELINNL